MALFPSNLSEKKLIFIMYFSLIYSFHCFFFFVCVCVLNFSRILTYLYGAALHQGLCHLICSSLLLPPSHAPTHHSNHWLPLGNPREPGKRYEYDCSTHYRDICLPLVILSVFSNFPKSNSHERSLINTKAISGLI